MVVTTFGPLWDFFIFSTCHSIVNCFTLIYLFITHQLYWFILNLHLSRSVLFFTQNSSAASSVPYRAFKHSAYIILRPFSSAVMYYIYTSGSIRANNSAIISSKLKCVLPLVLSVCKKYPGIYTVATYLSSLASIMH